MALPTSLTPWPPAQIKDNILPALGIWSAWYSGNVDQLSAVYGGQTGNDPTQTGFFASDHGGFRATVGRAVQRWFWGEPTRGPNRRNKLHIPIAADICQASADLLFADAVKFTAKDKATQVVLDGMVDDSMLTKLAEAAEIAAALGGVYVRISWDKQLKPDSSFLTTVDSDQALPEFRYDVLTAVTFWQVLKRDNRTVWRHLERHELDSQGNGIILHGLYEGTADNLGRVVPLTELAATAPLAQMINQDGVISTESPGLAVVYVPNQRPQRRWRTDPLGKSLGRSDLDGIESLMDSLDETYSSWMRDVRLGKARIMVARSLLDNNGAGNGMSFDADQELYSPLTSLSKGDVALAQQIQQVQFAIRVDEHQRTAQDLIEQILRTAGYSAQTFGIGDTGTVRTATEIESKERRSLTTRERKIRIWTPKAADIVLKMLLINNAIFAAKVTAERPEVTFTDGVQETQLALAQTVQALEAARAASTKTKVAMVHPDWDDMAIAAEVALIDAEAAAATALIPKPSFGVIGADPGAHDPTSVPPAS